MSLLDGDDLTSGTFSYGGPSDGYRNIFPAKITAVTSGSGNFVGYFVYSWIEQQFNSITGVYSNVPNGRSGNATISPAFEINNDGTVPIGSFVWMRFKGAVSNNEIWEFERTAGGGGVVISVQGIVDMTTIPTTTGSTAVQTPSILTFDAFSGIYVGNATDDGTIVEIRGIASGLIQAGVVTAGIQSFGGFKTFGTIVSGSSGYVNTSFCGLLFQYQESADSSVVHADQLTISSFGLSHSGVNYNAWSFNFQIYDSTSTSHGCFFLVDPYLGTFLWESNANFPTPAAFAVSNGSTTFTGQTGTGASGDVFAGGLWTGPGIPFITIGEIISGGTLGSILFAGPGSVVLAQDNSNFFWDETNKRLGIHTNTPTAAVNVNEGTLQLTGTSQHTPSGGAGLEVFYDGLHGIIAAYDRGGSAYLPIIMAGLTLQFGHGGAADFYISNSGNCGFNTAGPSALVTVNQGTLQLTGASQVAPSANPGLELFFDGVQGVVIAYDRTGSAYLPIDITGSTVKIGHNNNADLFITAAGKVGINVTTPGARWEVRDTTSPQAIVSYDANNYVQIGVASVGYTHILAVTNGVAGSNIRVEASAANSGNNNGGTVYLTPGAGIGTGVAGQVVSEGVFSTSQQLSSFVFASSDLSFNGLGIDSHCHLLTDPLTEGLTPTISAGSGAGTSPTVTIAGTDQAGMISITTGSSPSVSAVIATITFKKTWDNAPKCVIIQSADIVTAVLLDSQTPYCDHNALTTAHWTINSSGVQLAATTAYNWFYFVMG